MATLVISYSRYDQPLVRAVVTLLRSASRDVDRAVFWDADIEPGEQWRVELRKNIDEAPQLFVFWCAHSSQSSEVRQEFLYALDRGKRVVPVLLDHTPLAAELASISAIDLRQAVRHSEDTVLSQPVALPQRNAGRWALAAGVLVGVLAVSAIFLMRTGPTSAPASTPSTTVATKPVPTPSEPAVTPEEIPNAPSGAAPSSQKHAGKAPPPSSSTSGRAARQPPKEPAVSNPAPVVAPPVVPAPEPTVSAPVASSPSHPRSPLLWFLLAFCLALAVGVWLYRRSRMAPGLIRGNRDTIAAAFSPFLKTPADSRR
jgi:hypothetical protein